MGNVLLAVCYSNAITPISQTTFLFTPPIAFSHPRRCSHCHQCSFTNPESQPHKPGVYPGERKQKTTLKSIAQRVRGAESMDPRGMQGNQREHTEYDYPMCDWRGCEEAKAAAPTPGGDTEHTDCGQPSKLSVARDVAGWHTSAINTSKSSGFFFFFFF